MDKKKLLDALGYGKDLEDITLLDVVGLFLLMVLLATAAPR